MGCQCYVTTSTRPGIKSRLPELDVELTERCDNNCLHCCINLPANDAAACREMPADLVQRILREAAELGCLQVRFTGGEPLVRDDFAKLYLFTRRLGMKVLLFTNGRRITPELAELFSNVPPLMPIEVSVYGMGSKSYDAAARVPGAFTEFQRGVDLLLARRVPFVVKWAVLPTNRDERLEFESWAAGIPGMNKRPASTLFFQMRDRRDDPARNRVIEGLRPSPEECVSILSADPEFYRREMREFGRMFFGPPGDRLFQCGVTGKPCVDAYGRLQPCLGLRAPEFSYDLCAGGSLPEARATFFPRMLELRANNPEYLRRCARCFIKSLCEQCPARSWSEHGTLDTPVEYFCAVAHAQAVEVGWLRKGEQAWEVIDWRERVDAPLD